MTDDDTIKAGVSGSRKAKNAPSNATAVATEGKKLSVPEIEAMVVEHELWISSGRKDGKRANFRGCTLSGADLQGRHLVEANLRGANLSDANLARANLQEADLSEAILTGAQLTDANLANASLANATITGIKAQNADCTGANFTGAAAEDSVFTHAKLANAILRDGNFRRTAMTHAGLQGANLRGAFLGDADLSEANLSGADCRETDFVRTRFSQAVLKETNFRGAKLGEVDLHSADFSAAIDIGTEFQAQALQSERAKIQKEQAQLGSWRSDLEAREKKLSEEKRELNVRTFQMDEKEKYYTEAETKCGKFAFGFIFRFVMWLLVCVALAAFVFLNLPDANAINWSALLLTTVTPAFLLLLSLFSMVRSLQMARIVKKLETAGVPPVLKEPVRPASPDASIVIPPTIVGSAASGRGTVTPISSTVAVSQKTRPGFGKKS